MRVCDAIFEKIEIDNDGESYFCCEARVKRFSIGNVFKNDFEKVWNSEIAVKIREEALKGKYPYCNAKVCHKLVNNPQEHFREQEEHFKPIMEKYPKQISFPIDQDCNAKCIFCRDKIVVASEEELSNLRKKLHKIYLPMCKDVEYLTVNNLGDAFSSRFSREFMKEVSAVYPNIKFIIMTNGIAATKETIQELNLEGRIKEFDISINAVKSKTHKKIFRNNGFNFLLKNLEYIAELKKNNKIENLNFNFVICKYNWKEMKAFIKFARKHNAKINFWEVRDYYNDSLENKMKDMAVHNEISNEYKKFAKYLCSSIFDSEDVVLSPVIKEIREKELSNKKRNIFQKLFN